MRSIKPFNSTVSLAVRDGFQKSISSILDSGNFVLGAHTNALETLLGVEYSPFRAVTVSSGTVALECLFEFLFFQKQVKKVGVPSNTNFATVSSIIRSGAKPIFVDCDEDGQMCPVALKSLMEKTALNAVIVVHIGGYVSKNINELIQLCEEHSCFFLEDCAHAHGSSIDERMLGTLGYASILSFFPTKLVNGGEGGALITADAELIQFASMWRNQGKGGIFGNYHEVLGGSYRMPEFNCAFAEENYKNLNFEISRRKEIAEILVREVKKVRFSSADHMSSFSCYKLISIHNDYDGESVENYLKKSGVHCGGAVYRTPCHLQPVFSDVDVLMPLVNTETFCRRHFCLPVHSGLDEKDVDYLVSTLNTL